MEPAPDRQRQTTWATFMKAHWDVLAAIDFTTVGGLDEGRTGHVLPAVRHGVEDAPRSFRGLTFDPTIGG